MVSLSNHTQASIIKPWLDHARHDREKHLSSWCAITLVMVIYRTIPKQTSLNRGSTNGSTALTMTDVLWQNRNRSLGEPAY